MPESAEEKAARLERELETERGRSRSAPTEQGRTDARKVLNRHRGRAEEALAAVIDENKELRTERRELRDKVKKYETPGSVVLSADDAKEYEALKALGKAADVKKSLEKVASLETKVAEHDRRKVADEAAPLAGYNAEALRELITDKRLEISFRDEVKDGKTVRVPLVKPTGAEHEKTAPVPLVDYAKQSLAAYLPALTAKPSTSGTPNAGAAGGKTGTPFVEQSSGSSTAPTGDKPRAPATGHQYMTPSQRAKASNNAAS